MELGGYIITTKGDYMRKNKELKIRIEESTLAEIKRVAEDNDLPYSLFVRNLIKKHLRELGIS